MAAFAHVLVDEATRMSEQWQDGEVIDVAQAMRRLALVTLGQAFLGIDLGAWAARIFAEMDDLRVLRDPLNLLLIGW